MTIPTFCNELVWMTWNVRYQVGVVFNGCWRVWWTIRLLTFVCDGKGCGFKRVRGQILMTRRLGTSISENARLVGCARSTVVCTYAKWMNDGKTSSRLHGVECPHVIKEKVVRDCPAWWSKTGARQWLRWQPNTVHNQVEMCRSTLVSGPCWIWGYAADDPLKCLCWPSVISNCAYSGPENMDHR